MQLKRFLALSLALAVGTWAAPAGAAFADPAPASAQSVDGVQTQALLGNIAPTSELMSPAPNATATAPATFSLEAFAEDPDGSILRVVFKSGATTLATVYSEPYSFTWTNVAQGTYTLTAVATDNLNKSTTSAPVTVTVNASSPPTVSLTAPTDGSTYTAPASIAMTATASDSQGIAKVEFLSDGVVVATDTTSPYTGTYANAPAGSHTLTAKATDNGGNTAVSAPRSVTVTSGGGGGSTTVTLTSPTDGSSWAINAPISMAATVTGTQTISKVRFKKNGQLLSSDLSAPYSATFTPTAAGSYALTAEAMVSGSVVATSATVNVTVGSGGGGGGTVSVTRTYVYDVNQRLCKTIDPEAGATLMDYDGAGNIAWVATGTNLTSNTCDRGSVTTGQKTLRTYDARNRLIKVQTPGGVADVTTTYTPDSLVQSVVAANGASGANPVTTTYTYNNRRLLETESQPDMGYALAYGYNANGHLASLKYPDNQIVTYSPDALGRATVVQTDTQVYASSITYFPNGAISGFTYGNGVVHTMTPNLRGLPEHVRDAKTSNVVLDDTYTFDENGNVTDIRDLAQSDLTTRGMGYDALDRLTAAVSPAQWGNATYSYDAIDNLRTANQGVRQFTYAYDVNNRLASISGSQAISFGYDANGNVTSKNTQDFTFDAANRMASAEVLSGIGVQSYRYDGAGRRTQSTDPGSSGATTYWMYSQSGQVLYTSEARRSRNLDYIYLGNTQLATRAWAWGSGDVTINYEHTDALGSIVAESNATGAVVKRNAYAPYGEAYGATSIDGTGYTGHVMDHDTGLTYMQQRYYDPVTGGFISVDPNAVDVKRNAFNFNRYYYANNNPYRFTDPDGRESPCFAAGYGCGLAPSTHEIEQKQKIAMAGLVGMTGLAAAGAVLIGGAEFVGVSAPEILAANQTVSTGVELTGSAETVVANMARYGTKMEKVAVAIRDIAGRHLFADGNKRTASMIVQKLSDLNKLKLSPTQVRQVVNGVASGKLRTIPQIVKALSE